ncbi:MAG: hypothetical protein ACI8RD_007734, partial [Bacillariaceae sp.]
DVKKKACKLKKMFVRVFVYMHIRLLFVV